MPSGMTLTSASLHGAAVFAFHQPGTASRVHAERMIADLMGLETTFNFDWGMPSSDSGLLGTTWTLGWVRLNNADFGALQDYYELAKGTLIVWDAGSTAHLAGHTYNVIITALRSKDEPVNTLYKNEVEMDLLITKVN